ncbi:MAG: hypothetical protein NTW86_06100 [Candidatus Sumerlaeota bacterium]|nr:hypothetical protein [Candidatus Sumerlaeota bacterium]
MSEHEYDRAEDRPDNERERTGRQEMLVELMAAGKSARSAAVQVGYSESYADVITARRPDLVESARERARAALEEAGATVEKAVEVYAAALEAVDADGRPDYAIRQRAADRVLALWGVSIKGESAPPGAPGVGPRMVQNNLIIAAQESARERLRQLIAEGRPIDGPAALRDPAVAGRLLEALETPDETAAETDDESSKRENECLDD